jgi:hypothetical protein
MPTTKGHTSAPEFRASKLAEMDWNSIDKPGSYLNVATGDLCRVPAEALAPGHSPLITLTSIGETRLARLSENPATPVSVLRAIAADNDYFVNF